MDGNNQLFWNDFERDLRIAKRSPRTIQSYEEAAAQLADFHDGAPFDEMTKKDVQDYLLEVIERPCRRGCEPPCGHSATSAGVRFRSLRAFFNWMVREEIIESSPMARITEPNPEEAPTAVPPLDHVRALLATAEPKRRSADTRRRFNDLRDAAIIRLFCEAGAPRIAEMAGLEVGRVDMNLDVVMVFGKGARWRTIPFGDKTGKALTRYLRERPKHPLVVAARAKSKDPNDMGPARLWLGWRGVSGLNVSGVYRMITRRCDEAGIPRIHPHQLRHFATDQWYAAGGSVQDAMHLFGWKSPAMAHHYAQAHAGQRAIEASRRTAIGDQL